MSRICGYHQPEPSGEKPRWWSGRLDAPCGAPATHEFVFSRGGAPFMFTCAAHGRAMIARHKPTNRGVHMRRL